MQLLNDWLSFAGFSRLRGVSYIIYDLKKKCGVCLYANHVLH